MPKKNAQEYDEIMVPLLDAYTRELQADSAEGGKLDQLLDSPSYSLAFLDKGFMLSDAARAVRVQMEVMKPEWFLKQYGIRSTIIVFGSARFVDRETAENRVDNAQRKLAAGPDDPEAKRALAKAERDLRMSEYYELAREFGRLVSEEMKLKAERDLYGLNDYVICTGGGPGIMEAGNRGAKEAAMPTIGLNIKLPYEQKPNPYISPQLCFQFHYFAIRKLHFLLRAKALVVFPGGFGTFDELFEALTLRQTDRMQKIPVVIFGRDFWEKTIRFENLVDTGVIDREDLELFRYVDTPREAWNIIEAFYA